MIDRFLSGASELKERMQSARKQAIINIRDARRKGLIIKEFDEK